MKKFLKKFSLKKTVYAVLTFVMALCIIMCSLFAVARFTVFSRGFLSEILNSTEYYRNLSGELTEQLTDIGDASGLKRSFFENVVNEVTVRSDVQTFVDNFYEGEDLTVNSANFEVDLRTALNRYIKDNNIKNVNEENLDNFIAQACKIYSDSIKITYFSSIQKFVNEKTSVITIVAVVFLVLCAGIALILIFTNEWKHRSVRYIHTATASAGLVLLIAPLGVLMSGVIDKIAILSRSLNDMYTSVLKGIVWDVIIIAIVLLVISAALWVVHANLRRRSAV